MRRNKDKSLGVHWVLTEREVVILAMTTFLMTIAGLALLIVTQNPWWLLLLTIWVFPWGYLFVDSYAE